MATHFFSNPSCHLLPTVLPCALCCLHQDLGHFNSATGEGPLISNSLVPFQHRNRVGNTKNSETSGLWGNRALDHHPQQRKGEGGEGSGEDGRGGRGGEKRGGQGRTGEGEEKVKKAMTGNPEQFWEFSALQRRKALA